MNVVIENSAGKLNEIMIDEFESKFNIKLPEDYKLFLLQFNGGRPTPRGFITVDRKNISRVKMFFPLGIGVSQNLEEVYLQYVKGNKIPKTLLPIGIDPIDNLICLSLDKKDFGSILYWNKDEEKEGYTASYRWVKLVSKSFKEFLENLTE